VFGICDASAGVRAFALLDVMLLAGMIGDCASGCSDTCTDNGTLRAAHQASNYSPSNGGAADDLCTGMVAMVAAGLGALSLLMLIVGLRCQGKR